MIKSDSRILIVVAHPDDEVLGAGGLMSRFSSTNSIKVVVLGEGSSPRFNAEEKRLISNAIEERSAALRNAMSLLGIKHLHEHFLKCGCFSTRDILDINKIIESHINSFNPTHVFTHHYDDNNHDHRIVSRSIDMATRPKASAKIEAVAHFEIQSSTDWTFSGDSFSPNFFLELNQADLSLKQAAMKCYSTEFIKSIPSRSPDGLRILAEFRGIQSVFAYAEAYSIRRLNSAQAH